MTDHENRYQALLGNWTGATDPFGDVVVLMHGIRSTGDWAERLSFALARGWAGAGADAGQDVINLVNRRDVCCLGIRDSTEFGLLNAATASLLAALDGDTRDAGRHSAHIFSELRAILDSSSSRVREPIHVLAHSHGTSILLAASIHNHTHGKPFKINKAILAGSDISDYRSIGPFLDSIYWVRNYFSPDDIVVASVGGAGATGFRLFDYADPEIARRYTDVEVGPYDDHGKEYLVNIPRFRQVVFRDVKHFTTVAQEAKGLISWMSPHMGENYYSTFFALYSGRPSEKNRQWWPQYQALRVKMGLEWKIDPPLPFWSPYSRRF